MLGPDGSKVEVQALIAKHKLAETCDGLGFPTANSASTGPCREVVLYARNVDAWTKAGGRTEIAAKMGCAEREAA